MPLNPTHRTFNIIYSIAFQDSVLLISPILDFSLRCHLLYPTLVYIPVPLNLNPYVCIKPHGLAPHVLYSWDIMWFECYMAEVAVWNGWLIFFSIVLEQPAAAAAAAAWALLWTTAGEKRDVRDTQRQPRKQLIEGQKTERKDEERILKEVRKRKTIDREVNKLKSFRERTRKGLYRVTDISTTTISTTAITKTATTTKATTVKVRFCFFPSVGISWWVWRVDQVSLLFVLFFQKRKRKLLSSCCQYLFVRRLCFG